jgi:hypothetical protein
MTLQKLSKMQQEEFFEKHLQHRLTLLRAFRERKSWAEGAGLGDIYRCLKDSALISIRLLLEAMGLCACYDKDTGRPTLKIRTRREPDDVDIEQLGGGPVDPVSIPADDRTILAGIYFRANKELAHLTLTYDEEFNTPGVLLRGIDLVEELLRTHLYEKIGRQLPELSR